MSLSVCTLSDSDQHTAVKAIIAGIENKAKTVCGLDQHLLFDNSSWEDVIKVVLVVLGWHDNVYSIMVDRATDLYYLLVWSREVVQEGNYVFVNFSLHYIATLLLLYELYNFILSIFLEKIVYLELLNKFHFLFKF